MKYFKFTQISEETGISWRISQPLSGPSLPFTLLPGLTNIIDLAHERGMYIGEADDTAQANPENYIFEITTEQRSEELKKHVEHIIQERLDNIYLEENELRKFIFEKYDDSASIAGIYKYEEAKLLIEDNTAPAPHIRAEATIRNINPVVLAQRIIVNHEDFRSKEAKIAGIRGLIQDRLNTYSFNLQDPDASVAEFLSLEKVGEVEEEEYVDGQITMVKKDVMINKYFLDISTRFQHLD